MRGAYHIHTDRSEGSGTVQDVAPARNLEHGELAPTGNPLDFGLSGRGYFAVETPDGVVWARLASAS